MLQSPKLSFLEPSVQSRTGQPSINDSQLACLRIGFLSTQNYLNWHAFSGSLFSMYQALRRRGLKIVHLGEPKPPSLWQRGLDYGAKIHTLLTKNYITSDAELQRIRAKMQKQLDQLPCDVIFAPVAGGEVIHLNFRAPVVFLSDATAELLDEYYQWFKHPADLEIANQEEKIAIAKSSRIVYASEAAAHSAIHHYDADPDKVSVIPFGANLVHAPSMEAVLSRRHRVNSNRPCKLLFIGREWQRKGGDIAFETLLALHKRGIDAELCVVGCVPPESVQHDKLQVIPYLNKNNPRQRNQMSQLFLQSDFFVFPARGECFGIVLTEASAFGLPIITTDVGGIPTIVQNGRNGYTLPRSASGEEFAQLIAELFSDSARYQQLVRHTKLEYEQRLNWDHWAENMHQVFTLTAQEFHDRATLPQNL